MDESLKLSVTDQARAVQRYYDDNLRGMYLGAWSRDHIHFGLFEPGECPGPREDLLNSPGLARAMERMVEAIVAPAGIEARHRVVDAGCGIGGAAIHLAKTRGCSVTGVNVHRMQLEAAAGKAREAGLDGLVGFRFADCSLNLPFADASIDVVVNIESACHYSDRQQFLHEVRRILKPSGMIVAADWMVRDNLTAGEYEKHIEPMCGPWALPGLERQYTYTGKLREAGLEILQFEGFGGKDADNLRLIGYARNRLAKMQFFGIKAPGLRGLVEQFRTLHEAWSSGAFELRRYCARKP